MNRYLEKIAGFSGLKNVFKGLKGKPADYSETLKQQAKREIDLGRKTRHLDGFMYDHTKTLKEQARRELKR